MGMSLYELDRTMQDVLEQGLSFDIETGEVLFTSDDLDKLEISIDEKINNIVGFIKNLELESKTYAEISDEYKKRAESKSKKSKSLKNYLDSYLKSKKIDKKEVKNGLISYKESTSTNIYDEKKLRKYIDDHKDVRDRYIKTEITESFVKDELKKDLKNGIEIDGVELKTKNNLQVK